MVPGTDLKSTRYCKLWYMELKVLKLTRALAKKTKSAWVFLCTCFLCGNCRLMVCTRNVCMCAEAWVLAQNVDVGSHWFPLHKQRLPCFQGNFVHDFFVTKGYLAQCLQAELSGGQGSSPGMAPPLERQDKRSRARLGPGSAEDFQTK